MSEPGAADEDRDAAAEADLATVPDETPEADAIEQAREARAREPAGTVTESDEANEADVQEQSLTVDFDDDDDR